MLSDVAAQQAQVDLDQINYDRDVDAAAQRHRLRRRSTTRRSYTLDTDKSKLESLRQQAQVQLARLGGNPDIAGDAASAISAGQGAGRRGAAPARSHRRQGAVRRHRDERAVDRARQISRRLDDRLLSRRHRSRLGRCDPEGDRADLCAARAAGHGDGRHLSGRWNGTAPSRASARRRRRSSRCCRRRTPAATG